MERNDLLCIIAIVLVAFIGLFARYAIYDGKITHDFPITVNAGDPNSRLSEVEGIQESSSAKYIPPWSTGEADLLMIEPPLHLVIAALMAGASGAQIFDILYFDAVIAGIGAALCFFIVFSRILNNRALGLIVAVLLVYPLEQFFHYQINIGMYATFSTILFYPLVLFFLHELLKKPSWTNVILVALPFAFQFLMHSSEALVFGMAIGLYLLIFERKTVGWKKVIGIGVFVLLFTLPYWPPFGMNYLTGEGHGVSLFQGKEILPPTYEPQIFLTNVLHPAFYLLALLALVFTWNKKDYRLLNFLFVFYFLVIFVLAKFGIGAYPITMRARPIFFIYAYPIVGIGIFIVADTIRRLISLPRNIFIGAVVVLLLIAQGHYAINTEPLAGTLFTPDIYKGFVWIRDNSPKDARVLCMGCNQLEGGRSHRIAGQAVYWEEPSLRMLVNIANKNGTQLHVQPYTATYTDKRVISTGFLRFANRGYLPEERPSICSYNYIAFRSAPEQVAPVFTAIAKNLIEKNATIVFSTPTMLVLKNNLKEGCI
jgi:hypothetical protein